MKLIYKQYHILTAGGFLYHAFQALLKVAAILRPGEHRRQVKGIYPLPEKPLRDAPRRYALRESLHYGGLADSGVPDEAGIILAAPQQHPYKAVGLLLPAYHRVELPGGCKLGEVPAVFRERREFRAALLFALLEVRLDITLRADLPRELHHIHAKLREYRPGAALPVEHHRAEKVLRPGLALVLGGGKGERVFHQPARTRREVVHAQAGRSPLADQRFQPPKDFIATYAVPPQHRRGRKAVVAYQPVKHVLAADIGVTISHSGSQRRIERLHRTIRKSAY